MDYSTIEAYAARWNAHDIDGLLRHFADNIVYKDAAMTLRYAGKDELRSFLEEVFRSSSDARFTTEAVYLGPEGGFWEWTFAGTMTGAFERMEATYQPFSWKGVSVMEFDGSLIKRVTDYCLMGEIKGW